MSVNDDDVIAKLEAAQMTPEKVGELAEELRVAIAAMPDKTGDIGALKEMAAKIATVPDVGEYAELFARLGKKVQGEDARKFLKDARKSHDSKRKEQTSTSSARKLRQIDSPIPLPPWADGCVESEGRKFMCLKRSDGTSEILHSPLRLRSALTYLDKTIHGRMPRQGVLIEFVNAAGETKALPFLRSDASTRGGREKMIADLVDAGVAFAPTGSKAMLDGILAGGSLGGDGLLFDYPGWREENVFLAPDGLVIGDTNRDIGIATPLPGIGEKGTLDAWRSANVPAFDAEILAKAPHVPACLLWGFVSPLIDRAREDSMVLFLAGWTTGLKSFSMRLMASVWGSDEKQDGLLVSFNATANKLEHYAIERSGCGLAVDETKMIDGKELGGFIYRLAGNAEKGRLTKESLRWRLACAISSERPLADCLSEAKVKNSPGLMSRVIELAAPGDDVSQEAVDTMKGAFQNYGHAGPLFVKAMVAEGYDREKIVSEIDRRVNELAGDGAQQERRASRAVAYLWLAGELAQRAGLIPESFDVRAFVTGVWESCRGAADTKRVVANRVIGSLSKALRSGRINIYSPHGNAFASGDGGECDGAICVTDFGRGSERVFVLPAATLARVAGESTYEAAKILDGEGALLREREGRLYWQPGRAEVGNVKAYVIHAGAVLGDEADTVIEEHRLARLGQAVAPMVSRPALHVVNGAGGVGEAAPRRAKH